jgi:hypothetical protein
MKKILSFILATILAFSVVATPAFAADKNKSKKDGVETAILTTCGQDSDGVGCILRLVVDIMSIGIGGGRPHTLEEVGAEFDVTRERIRQIEAKALSKLRKNKETKKLHEYLK